MKKILKLLLLTTLICFTSVTVLAAKQEGSAKITKIEGTANIKRRGGKKSFKAVKGMKLVQGDMLYTSKGSNVSLTFENGNQSVVGENTFLTFEEMKKLSNDKSSVSMKVDKGSIFSNVKKKLISGEKFEIRTPNAVAGVRGTKFFVKTDKNNTVVCVVKGQVEFASSNGKNSAPILVKKNQIAEVNKTSAAVLVEDTGNITQDNSIKDSTTSSNNGTPSGNGTSSSDENKAPVSSNVDNSQQKKSEFDKRISKIKQGFSKDMLNKADAFAEKDSIFTDGDLSEYMTKFSLNVSNINNDKKDKDKIKDDKKSEKNTQANLKGADTDKNSSTNSSDQNDTGFLTIPTANKNLVKVSWEPIDRLSLTLNGDVVSTSESSVLCGGLWRFEATTSPGCNYPYPGAGGSPYLKIVSLPSEVEITRANLVFDGVNKYSCEINVSEINLNPQGQEDIKLMIQLY